MHKKQPPEVDEVLVRSASRTYSVRIGSGLLRTVGQHPLVAGRHCFVVTTPTVFGLHGAFLLKSFPSRQKPTVLFVPEGEGAKKLSTVERLATELASAGAHRDCLLLALGGGVVGDITGFLAAIYQRGVEYVQLPTTLLAQVDSSVGGKTGVNLPQGKNLLGSFHSPLAVFAEIDALPTLPDREFRAGMFESIKCGIIRDAKLFQLMEQNRDSVLARDPGLTQQIVSASVRVKAGIVQRDESEKGERMLLNFGHTFGHALEVALHYKKLLHGEAVAWGMLASLHMGHSLGSMPQAAADRAAGLIRSYGPLPGFRLQADAVLAAASRDKKHSTSSQRYILASGIGSAFVAEGIPASEFRRSVEFLLQEAAAV